MTKEELSMKIIIKYQNFQGFCEDVSNLNSLSEKLFHMPPALEHIKELSRSHAFATIIALQLFHDLFSIQCLEAN